MHFPHFSRKICLILLTALLAAAGGVILAFGLTAGIKETMTHTGTVSTVSETQSGISSEAPNEPETPSSEVTTPTEPVKKSLVITSPSSLSATVTEPSAVITGVCDPSSPLEMNGKGIECNADGTFSVEVELSHGKNSFTFKHKDETLTCNIRYRYIVINAYNPGGSLSVDGGSTLVATVSARAGGTASATFNGKTVQLVRQSGEFGDEEFCNFSAVFTVPAATSKDVSLGRITFSASYKGISESFSSGNIVCKKVYIPQIAEVVIHSAETFNGGSRDNWTRPTNNYLPEGTVDYVTGSFSARDGKYVNTFLELRCGRRIYSDQLVTPGNSRIQVAKVYDGTLPDHNELSVAEVSQGARSTVITLNTLWKAPFLLDLLPQSYTNASAQDYTVSSFTAKYVEIKFCYATVFEGTIDISADNPLFSRSEIIRNADGSTTVRLHFKKTGAFYGWDCSYNNAGQLVFEFKHPPTVAAGTNEYGVDLSGVTILVDAGHGGIDPGAGSGACEEESRNLYLANLIKNELAKTGANVIMTRTSDTTLNSLDRVKKYRSIKPDFMVSVHHDSSSYSGANGFGSFYTTPFSQSAAKKIFDRTLNTGIYQRTNWTKLSWHYFYMTRMTYCPSVLTENGFVSSPYDQTAIADNAKNQIKAKAIAQGICDYFKSIN